MDEIQITLSADDAKAVRAWQRQRDNIEAFEKGLDGVGKKQKRVADDSDLFGAKALGSLSKMATTVIGIGSTLQAFSTAASLVAAEINNAVDRQKDAANANLSLPAAQRQLFANIGAESKELGATARERNAAALRMASKLADETGVDQKTATEALSNAFSARQGSDTTLTAYEAAKTGIIASPEDSSQAKILGAAALRLRAGRDDVTSQQAIGYMLEAGSLLPLEKTQDVATNLPRVVSAAKLAGGDERFAASIYGAATTSGVDVTGDPGATFITNLLEKLKKGAPEAKTPAEQIALLQSNKARGDAFIDQDFEARFKPFLRSLMSGGDAAKQFEQNMAKAKSFEQGGQAFQENIAAADVSPQVRLARLERALKGGAEREQMADVGGAAQSITREGLAAIAKAAGDSAISQDINNAMARLDVLGPGQDTESSAVGIAVKSIKERIKSQSAASYSYSGAEGADLISTPTTEQLEQSFRLQRTLDALLLLMQDIKGDGIKAKVNVARDDRSPPAPRDAAALSGAGQ